MAQKKEYTTPQFNNKKAFKDYEILEEVEAGLVLVGTEVKCLRGGKGSIREAYCRISEGEAWLVGSHIPSYENRGYADHEPFRKRKLLLHKRQIKKLLDKIGQQGFTLIPLRMYFNKRGRVKVMVGIARGKKTYDKRQDLKKRESKRAIDREMKRRG